MNQANWLIRHGLNLKKLDEMLWQWLCGMILGELPKPNFVEFLVCYWRKEIFLSFFFQKLVHLICDGSSSSLFSEFPPFVCCLEKMVVCNFKMVTIVSLAHLMVKVAGDHLFRAFATSAAYGMTRSPAIHICCVKNREHNYLSSPFKITYSQILNNSPFIQQFESIIKKQRSNIYLLFGT
ncbi:hypothetical protein ACP275_05G131800 [Erythranthe tilingii]